MLETAYYSDQHVMISYIKKIRNKLISKFLFFIGISHVNFNKVPVAVVA